MLDFAYPSLESTGAEAWKIGALSSGAGAGYIWAYWLPSLILLNPETMRIRPLEQVLQEGTPFIYPVELRWEFLDWFIDGRAREFLGPDVPPAVIDAAREGRAIIMPFYSHEVKLLLFQRQGDGAILSFYDLLRNFVHQQRLPPGAVWFLQGNLSGAGELDYWREQRKISPASTLPFEVRFVDLWSFMTQSFWRTHSAGQDLDLKWDLTGTAGGQSHVATHVARIPLTRPLTEVYAGLPQASEQPTPDRLFLCMNRLIRPHRRLIVSFLQWRGLLDRSLVSFHDNEPEKTLLQHTELQRAWQALQPKLPLKIDLENHWPTNFLGLAAARVDDLHQIKMVDAWPFRRTMINLVTESAFSSYYCFLSEKIWKPIINSQPFIVVGCPGTLAYLRRLGFRSFAPLIDETYDELTDDLERMNAIFQLLESIGRKTQAELAALHAALQPVARYNAALLRSMLTPMDIVFRDMGARLGAAAALLRAA